jgi:hypothetical protein
VTSQEFQALRAEIAEVRRQTTETQIRLAELLVEIRLTRKWTKAGIGAAIGAIGTIVTEILGR